MDSKLCVSLSSLVFILTTLYVVQAKVRVADFEVSIRTDKSLGRVSEKFISYCLDPINIVNHWQLFNPDAPEAAVLGKALSPAYLRMGGTTTDTLIFVGQQHEHGAYPNATFTAYDWDKLNRFAQRSNLSLIFGLNSLYRPGLSWDPTNAIELMKYSAQKGYVVDLELGNEPDIYRPLFSRNVDAQQLGRDFGTLRNLMNSMSEFKSRLLLGPDPTQATEGSVTYMRNFLKTGSEFVNALTFHHYYINGQTARRENFTDAKILDSLKYTLINARETIKNYSNGTKAFWLGETGSAYYGGAPGLSDTFLAGFMWLDKLGMSALYGAEAVLRQEFIGLNYGIVNITNGVYSVNPDFWFTILFKKLVGEKVLLIQDGDENLRVYAHCTNQKSGYGSGSVTFYMMNLYNTTKTVSFSQFTGQELHLYILSSGDQNTLVTKSVLLNGKPLELSSGQLPPLPPIVQNSSTVNVAPFTLGYIVVPGADAMACL